MATAAEARWLHQTPEERLGRYIPGRGRDGHMQYVPRSAGDSARLSSEDIERLYYAATRRGGLRSVQEDADRAQYVGRDQDEVKMMYMSMRATRDAARRGEHVAGWRLDAGRGAILRDAAWREAGRRDAALGREPNREATLQQAAAQDGANTTAGGVVHGDGGAGRRGAAAGGGGGRGGSGGQGGGDADGGDEDGGDRPDRNGDPVPPRGVATGDRGMLLAHPDEYEHYYRQRAPAGGLAHGSGYFGEEWHHRTEGAKRTPRMMAVRSMAMDGIHTGDGRHRSVRDLVSQLWFDDFDEATCGAEGLCDLCVPSNPQAAANREIIGATPSVFDGLERLVRSGSPNASYHACEALSQLAFRNSRNSQRIMDCRSPDLPSALTALLGLYGAQNLPYVSMQYPSGQPPAGGPISKMKGSGLPDDRTVHPGFACLDNDSQYDLQAAVLRVLNNCAWGSPRACCDIVDHDDLMNAVEKVLLDAWSDPILKQAANQPDISFSHPTEQSQDKEYQPHPPKTARGPTPVPLIMCMDAAVGLLNHLSTHHHSRKVVLSRRIAEDILLPMVMEADAIECPPEQFLCTLAGAVEVLLKLVWDEEDPPFLPHNAVLHTIVWTLACALDGIMWAGITWSSLSRVQALSKLSAVDDLKVHLVDLHTVEAIVRLLDQWTIEQGQLVLEYGLLTMLNLLTVEEARFRLYLTGVYRPLRSIILGDEGASDAAKEKAVLCAWFLFEWQVEKLEVLDRKVKELMNTLEDAERARMELEDEYARVRAEIMDELSLVKVERDAFREKCEVLQNELVSTQRTLQHEKRERQVENEVASNMVKSLENLVAEKDQDIEKLHGDVDEMKSQMHYWQEQAKKAAEDSRVATERQIEAEKQRDSATKERDKALMLAEIRYQEMLVESEARSRMEKLCDAHKTEEQALALTRQKLDHDNEWLIREVHRMENECAKRERRAHLEAKSRIAEGEHVTKQAEKLLKRYAVRDYYMSKRCKKLELDTANLWQALQDCKCPAKRYKPKTSIAGGWVVDEVVDLAHDLIADIDENPDDMQRRRRSFLKSEPGHSNEDGLEPWVTPRDRLRASVELKSQKRKSAFDALNAKYATARERAVKLKETEWEKFWMNLSDHTGMWSRSFYCVAVSVFGCRKQDCSLNRF